MSIKTLSSPSAPSPSALPPAKPDSSLPPGSQQVKPTIPYRGTLPAPRIASTSPTNTVPMPVPQKRPRFTSLPVPRQPSTSAKPVTGASASPPLLKALPIPSRVAQQQLQRRSMVIDTPQPHAPPLATRSRIIFYLNLMLTSYFSFRTIY